jgi:4-hydroxy-4-methyl-2-oxoglutarate aldolase
MGTPLIPALSLGQIQALQRIDSPTIANAIEAFEVRDPTEGYASLELRCLFPDLATVVGFAVTCTADSISPDKNRPDQSEALYQAIRAAPKPAVVVIKDVGSDRLRGCHAGDVMCTLFQTLGAVALVTDGGVRDLRGIRQRAPGFQLFAAGTVVAHGVPTIVEVGKPVPICGLTIQPGDLLHGDLNGLVSIPLAIADRVAAQAEKVWASEREIVEFIKSSAFTLEALGEKYGW